jgi:hypothetical protein
VGFLLGLSAAATVASLIYARHRRGAGAVPIPGYPWVQAGFIVATLAISALMAVRDPRAVAIALGTVAAGAPIYLWMVSRRRLRPAAIVPKRTAAALADSNRGC